MIIFSSTGSSLRSSIGINGAGLYSTQVQGRLFEYQVEFELKQAHSFFPGGVLYLCEVGCNAVISGHIHSTDFSRSEDVWGMLVHCLW